MLGRRHPKVFCKKVALKNFANSQENVCAGVSFLRKRHISAFNIATISVIFQKNVILSSTAKAWKFLWCHVSIIYSG